MLNEEKIIKSYFYWGTWKMRLLTALTRGWFQTASQFALTKLAMTVHPCSTWQHCPLRWWQVEQRRPVSFSLLLVSSDLMICMRSLSWSRAMVSTWSLTWAELCSLLWSRSMLSRYRLESAWERDPTPRHPTGILSLVTHCIKWNYFWLVFIWK